MHELTPDVESPAKHTERDHGGIAGHPRGLSMLFYAEMWERFSYYGMRAILLLFMIAPLAMGGMGMDQKDAAQIYGNYTMASYMVCILGGYLADNFIGARRAVLIGGLIITAGHYCLAFASEPTFYTGLILVALGTGLLKPSISTLVGGLYSHGDTRRDAGFSLFYMGINLGAFAAPLVVGWLAQGEQFKALLTGWGLDPTHSWHWGFGAAGIGMTIGMIVYLRHWHWLSHIGHPPEADTPRPWGKLVLVALGTAAMLGVMIASDYVAWINPIVFALPFVGVIWFGVVKRDIDSRRIAAILVFFICAILFWAVFEQAGSSLTLFAWLWVSLRERQPSIPMKFVWGLVFLGLSFALLVPAAQLTAAGKVSPWWLIGVYFLQTIGELCLSPVGLSAMTKLAPAKLAGLVMGIWFLGTALGNKLAGSIAAEFNAKDPQALAHFFWQQALLVGGMTVLLLVLVPWVRRLTGEQATSDQSSA